MERKIQNIVASNKKTYPKDALLKQIETVRDSLASDLVEGPTITKKINTVMSQIKKYSGDSITTNQINNWKRDLWKAAYNKNNSEIVNDSLHAVGGVMKGILDTSVKGLEKINKDYGVALLSRRILNKAVTKPQVGLVGKLSEYALGAGIGTAIGGPVGGLVGAGIAPNIVSSAITPVRTATSFSLNQIQKGLSRLPADKQQLAKKALLNFLTQLQD
jgi:hypothetical protein